jgi:hypothetical protein
MGLLLLSIGIENWAGTAEASPMRPPAGHQAIREILQVPNARIRGKVGALSAVGAKARGETKVILLKDGGRCARVLEPNHAAKTRNLTVVSEPKLNRF